jgi:Mlc titration factor MtfA (ptsG expression regulator)
MMPGLLVIILTLVAVVWAALHAKRLARRKRLMTAPLPEAWREILVRNLPPYVSIPEGLQARLHGYINVFLDEKRFEGCGGQEITDEVRVTIAGQACLLLLGRGSKCYPKLKSVLVYPHTYVAGGKGLFGAQNEERSVRLGESWQTGAVVLAWDSVRGGALNFHDGHNVVLHEFAHQLDQADGVADGTPVLDNLSCYGAWARCLTREYTSFLKRVSKHKPTVIDEYGATNSAEFFATATEAFFEKPDQLHRKRPDLYEELKHYYHMNPLEW